MRKVLVLLVLAIVVAGAVGYFSLMKGVDLVKQGLVDNYPLAKHLIHHTRVRTDTVIELTVSSKDIPGLNLSDSAATLRIPYRAEYGIDLSVRNYKLFRDGKEVECMLPPIRCLFHSVYTKDVLLNGQAPDAPTKALLQPWMEAQLESLLIRDKRMVAEARLEITKGLMYLFIPYGFGLRLYIDNTRMELPLLPGINQKVDDYLNQLVKNKPGA